MKINLFYYFILMIILAILALGLAALVYTFYKYDPVIISLASSISISVLTTFIVFNPWKISKRKELEEQICVLSNLLENATQITLKELKKTNNNDKKFEVINAWAKEVGDTLKENNLIMYKVFFDNLHNIQHYFSHPISSVELIHDKPLLILDAKRIELKEIIKDLNLIKNKL